VSGEGSELRYCRKYAKMKCGRRAITRAARTSHNMNEKNKAKVESGPRSLQREALEGGSDEELTLRQKIKAIRQGHTTGGYCDTEALHAAEKQLAPFLHDRIAICTEQHSFDAVQAKRITERELASLAWKPRLVVAPE